MLACDASADQLTGVYKRLYDDESTLELDQAQTSALIRCLFLCQQEQLELPPKITRPEGDESTFKPPQLPDHLDEQRRRKFEEIVAANPHLPEGAIENIRNALRRDMVE